MWDDSGHAHSASPQPGTRCFAAIRPERKLGGCALCQGQRIPVRLKLQLHFLLVVLLQGRPVRPNPGKWTSSLGLLFWCGLLAAACRRQKTLEACAKRLNKSKLLSLECRCSGTNQAAAALINAARDGSLDVALRETRAGQDAVSTCTSQTRSIWP